MLNRALSTSSKNLPALKILHQHKPNSETESNKEPGESHQLHIGVERFRAPELLFQPSMIGSIEAGLTETIKYILSQFTPNEQTSIVSNIVLMGGCAALPGLKDRLYRELKEIRPFQSNYYVNVVKNPGLTAWHGAKNWAKNKNFEKFLTTKQDYLEFGGEYFKDHKGSNVFFATPKSINVPTEVE